LLPELRLVAVEVARLRGRRAGNRSRADLARRALAELAADSLDLVELVMALEEEFDVTIPEDAAERINTVDDAIRYIVDARRFRSDEERG